MGYSSGRGSQETSILKFNPSSLETEKLLVDEIEKILRLSKKDEEADRFIGKTSSTAYRRVHEIVTSGLDKLIDSKTRDPTILTDLVRALIQVRYQASRHQISSNLADYLDKILSEVIRAVKNAGTDEEWEKAKKLAFNARLILDAIIVLVTTKRR